MYKDGWLFALLVKHRPDNHSLAGLNRYVFGSDRDKMSKVNKGRRRVQSAEAPKIAEYLGISNDEFLALMEAATSKDYQKSPVNTALTKSSAFVLPTGPATIKGRRTVAGEKNLPVYGRGRGSRGGTIIDTEIQQIVRPQRLDGVEEAYALRVAGDEMKPVYYDGDFVYVHPVLPLEPGRGVVIAFHDREAITRLFCGWTADAIEVEEMYPHPRKVLIPRESILSAQRIVGKIEP